MPDSFKKLCIFMEIVKVYTYPIVVVCTYYCTYSKGFHKYCKRLHFFVDKQKNQWEYTRSIKRYR